MNDAPPGTALDRLQIGHAVLERLAQNLVTNITLHGEGRDGLDRLAKFAAAHELDLQDTATLYRVASGEKVG